jgi:NADPH:quinone reductase-like Zn-dependent oxidoreductase
VFFVVMRIDTWFLSCTVVLEDETPIAVSNSWRAQASPFFCNCALNLLMSLLLFGAQAEYASASETMIARKPLRLSDLEAASAPVVAVTAWQMLHDYAHVQAGQTFLVLGAAGNVRA